MHLITSWVSPEPHNYRDGAQIAQLSETEWSLGHQREVPKKCHGHSKDLDMRQD